MRPSENRPEIVPLPSFRRLVLLVLLVLATATVQAQSPAAASNAPRPKPLLILRPGGGKAIVLRARAATLGANV